MNYCRRGLHDKDITGMTADGSCRECRNAGRRRAETPLRLLTLPTAPLRAWMDARGLTIRNEFGWHSPYERAAYRTHISVDLADKIATKLGAHPYEIWGEAFYVGCDAVGLDEVRA